MKIPSKGKIYSINEGYESEWEEGVKQYVHNKKYPKVRGLASALQTLTARLITERKALRRAICGINGESLSLFS